MGKEWVVPEGEQVSEERFAELDALAKAELTQQQLAGRLIAENIAKALERDQARRAFEASLRAARVATGPDTTPYGLACRRWAAQQYDMAQEDVLRVSFEMEDHGYSYDSDLVIAVHLVMGDGYCTDREEDDLDAVIRGVLEASAE